MLGTWLSSPGHGHLGSKEAPSKGWRQGLRRAHSAPSAEEHSERGTALSHDVGLEKLRGAFSNTSSLGETTPHGYGVRRLRMRACVCTLSRV